MRFVASPGSGARLVADAAGAARLGRGVVYRVRGTAVIHVAWVHARAGADIVLDGAVYDAARRAVSRFWDDASWPAVTALRGPRAPRLRRRAEPARPATVSRLALQRRQPLRGALVRRGARRRAGHGGVRPRRRLRGHPPLRAAAAARAVLRTGAPGRCSSRPPTSSGSPATATLLDSITPALATVLRRLERQLRGRGPGLLDREAFSSDVRRPVIGLHGQAVGLAGPARDGWRLVEPRSTPGSRRAPTRGGRPARARAPRRAVRARQRRLADGSLFVPGRARRPRAAVRRR